MEQAQGAVRCNGRCQTFARRGSRVVFGLGRDQVLGADWRRAGDVRERPTVGAGVLQNHSGWCRTQGSTLGAFAELAASKRFMTFDGIGLPIVCIQGARILTWWPGWKSQALVVAATTSRASSPICTPLWQRRIHWRDHQTILGRTEMLRHIASASPDKARCSAWFVVSYPRTGAAEVTGRPVPIIGHACGRRAVEECGYCVQETW